jgi:hypothetical protein
MSTMKLFCELFCNNKKDTITPELKIVEEDDSSTNILQEKGNFSNKNNTDIENKNNTDIENKNLEIAQD